MTLYQYCIDQKNDPNKEKNLKYEAEINAYQVAAKLTRDKVIDYIIYMLEELK